MSTLDTLLEGRIRDVDRLAIQTSGTVYTNHIVQVQSDTSDIELQHSFYKRTTEGVNTKLGAIVWTDTGVSFDVLNDSNGEIESVFEVGTGGITVNSGTASFGTSEVNVEDKDLVLGSAETLIADLNGGGIILGRLVDEDTGDVVLTDGTPPYILYSNPNGFWSSNIGFNVESGNAFTIGTNVDPTVTSVSLDEIGLTIVGATSSDNVVLSAAGLALGTDVSLDSDGLNIGSDLSFTTADGLVAGDITLNSTTGLAIGSALSLTTADGLVAGDITLNSSLGLEIGSDLKLNSVDGLTFVATDTSGDVTLDPDGIYIGNDISITKLGGLDLGGSTITSDSIVFGTSPDETTLDDTSLQLGEDVLLNHDGLSLVNTDSAVFLGNKKWKIVFDASTDNLKFQYDSTGGSGTYITKAEMKST